MNTSLTLTIPSLIATLLMICSNAQAQVDSVSLDITKPVIEQKQCQWNLLQSSNDQSTKVPEIDWQSFAEAVEALIAINQNPSQLAFQSQLRITNADVAIGGGNDSESFISDHCWKEQ